MRESMLNSMHQENGGKFNELEIQKNNYNTGTHLSSTICMILPGGWSTG
jgi:hypothetical protein